MITDHSRNVLAIAEKEGHQQVDEFCASMAESARESDETPKVTGHMKRSVTHETNGLIGSVFTETAGEDGSPGYGFWVHEGTANKDGSTRMEARPFLLWAYQRTEADFK